MADGFSGMAELIADLRKLPEALKGEVSKDVHSAADAMVSDLQTNYPSVTGNLRRGVKQETIDPLKVKVRSTAPHAHLYEYGTARNQPARPTFIPAAIRHRKRMHERFGATLRRIKVSGMTGSA